MATNFGFMPVLEGKRYFISYKSEDTERVGEITRRLNEMGVPMWYDYGIEKGKRWSAEINRNIEECEAFILFATRALFAVEDTWVRKEFRLAIISQKNKYIVWLDDLNPFSNPNDVHLKLRDWYLDLEDLQGLKEYSSSPDLIAWRMVTELDLIYGMPPQPPSPVYHPNPEPEPAPKPEPEPKPIENKPVAKQQPAQKRTPLLAPRMDVHVGGKVTFGQYPQGANGEMQPLVWRVLAVENDRALLITDKLIDYVRYNENSKDVTWKDCTLRKWMNGEFITKAFSGDQQIQIVTVDNQNPDNPKYGTKGGNITPDKIFALSIDEANQYFTSINDRKAYTTEYAHSKMYDASNRSENWWLRSPGVSSFAADVGCDGVVHQLGYKVNRIPVAVRPAMWLNLE